MDERLNEEIIMKQLHTQQIIKDMHWSIKVATSSIFLVVGMALSLGSIIPLFIRFDQKSLLVAAVVTICFGGLFGIYFGALRLKKNLCKMQKVRRGEYVVMKDVVTSLEDFGYDPDHAATGCYLTFAQYSKQTGKTVMVMPAMLRQTNPGDEFYLILLEGEEKPLNIYPAREYVYIQ